MVIGLLDTEVTLVELEERVRNIPCLPKSSSHPLSTTESRVNEVFKGWEIIPWEVRGVRNHIDLLNRWDSGVFKL